MPRALSARPLPRRLLSSLALLSVLSAGLVALPTLTTATATPRPVEPQVTSIPLTTPAPGAALRREGGTTAAAALLSAALDTDEFSLLGVTWAPDPAVGEVDVQVRHRKDGAWSDWEPVEEQGDEGPDPGTVDTAGDLRSGTNPMWVGPSDGVQVKVHALTGAAPRDVRIELVDPGTSPADALPTPPRGTATAGGSRPPIITRAQWGADESIRRGSPSYVPTVKVGFVHHTASSNDYSPSQAAAMVRGIYAYHVKSNGWSDIGYNFLVDRYGRAYEGRYGGMDRYVAGAHTGGFNYNSFAVSLLGDFSTVPPSSTTLGTLSKVLAWKLGSAHRDPQGKAVLTSAGGGTSKYRSGASVTFDVVSGHRDAGNTSCPGATTYARMDDIRSMVSAELGAAFVEPVVTGGPTVRQGSDGPVTLSARTLGDVTWTLAAVDSAGALVRQWSGRADTGTLRVEWDLRDAAGERLSPGTYGLRLSGVDAGDVAPPYATTITVEGRTCGGLPLLRARCRAQEAAAKRPSVPVTTAEPSAAPTPGDAGTTPTPVPTSG